MARLIGLMSMALIGVSIGVAEPPSKIVQLYPEVQSFVAKRIAEFDRIPEPRKHELGYLSKYIEDCKAANKPIRITFVCTHNSRRSQLAQLWSQVAAAYYGIPQFEAYSGGVESTAFNSKAVEAAKCSGFKIEKTTEDENPVYHVRFSDAAHPVTCFSKMHNQPPNPKSDFLAIMVCSDADRSCPTVPGAAARLAIPYVDPKSADNTPEEASVYDERNEQIAREILYAFSRLGEK